MPARTASLAAAISLLLLSGCDRAPTEVDPDDQDPPGSSPRGLVEVMISGIGEGAGEVRASARPLAFDRPDNTDGGGDGSIQLEPLSSGSFTAGARDGTGERYLFASFRVRNADESGRAYDTPRRNLTFMAVATEATLEGTAITRIQRFDGSDVTPGLALRILPTGSVRREVNGSIRSRGADVLQVITEAEAAEIDLSGTAATSVFPYGFVVRHADTGGRTLPASPAADQFDGVVTFAFRVPLQASAAEDAFTIRMIFLAVDDPETRITQSLEEQDAAGQAAFAARADAIAAEHVTLLPRGQYAGPLDVHGRCGVRTAGPAGSPTAEIAPCRVASIELTPVSAFHLVTEQEHFQATLRDEDGAVIEGYRVAWRSSDESVATVDRHGVATLRWEGAATITAEAEGHTATATITGENIVWETVTAGDGHSCGLSTSGAAFCWGANSYGQLGDGSTSWRTTRVRVAGGHTFTQISAGGIHTMALTAAGAAYAWGGNATGQLGDGTTETRHTPTPVEGGHAFVRVSAGRDHTVGLTAGGAAYGWGFNGSGQLGDGTRETRLLPAAVADGHSFVTVHAGLGDHTVALDGSGAAYAWGANSSGQLGDGTRTIRDRPVAVSGGRSFIQIDPGAAHTVALTATGAAFAWGNNFRGQLGDGTTTNRDVPTAVSTANLFTRISAGTAHTAAITVGLTGMAWGANDSGQLGDGTTGVRPTPTHVTGTGRLLLHISAGGAHTAAVYSGAAGFGWGLNASGQLGDWTTTNRTVPTRMAGG